jgi:hypothetical protein
MNSKQWIVRSVALIFLGAVAAWAATQRWSYDSTPVIFQIVADGSGGCAYVRLETNTYISVLWLDRKGTLIYRVDLATNEPATIVRCTKKQLVYAAYQDSWRFVQVANDGTATPITAGNNTLTVPLLRQEMPVNVMADRKGFFGVLVTIPGSRQTLVRFDNK